MREATFAHLCTNCWDPSYCDGHCDEDQAPSPLCGERWCREECKRSTDVEGEDRGNLVLLA